MTPSKRDVAKGEGGERRRGRNNKMKK